MKPGFKITLIYLVVGILWILVSDQLLLFFYSATELDQLTYLQHIKGVFFVVTTSVMLYFLVEHYNKSLKVELHKQAKLNKELSEQKLQIETTKHELEQFTFVASQYLQEPLRMITGFLAKLKRKFNSTLDEKAVQYFYFAEEGTEKMKEIIIDLISYSQIGREKLQTSEFEMSELVDDCVLLHHKIIEDTKAVIKWDPMPKVRAEKSYVELLLSHLILNAIKFRRDGMKPEITISAKEEEHRLCFCVADNGMGIKEQDLLKIFTIFQRLNTSMYSKGNGMGLAICKKIVNILGGEIWVESTYGKGSNFYFTIPKRVA